MSHVIQPLPYHCVHFLDGQRISELTSVVARAVVVSDFETSNFKADRRLTKKLKLYISAAATTDSGADADDGGAGAGPSSNGTKKDGGTGKVYFEQQAQHFPSSYYCY